MQLFIVQPQINQGRAFGAYQVFYFGIVIAFVFAAKNQYGLGCHALQSIPARIDIGRFGVVDELDAAYGRHLFQTVFHTLEVGQGFAYIFFPDACKIGGDTGRQ